MRLETTSEWIQLLTVLLVYSPPPNPSEYRVYWSYYFNFIYIHFRTRVLRAIALELVYLFRIHVIMTGVFRTRYCQKLGFLYN